MSLPASFCEKLSDALVTAGVQDYRAIEVASFVTKCYDLLLCAHIDLTEPARWKKFCSKRGATTKRRTRKAEPANVAETAITADLCLEMTNLLQSAVVVRDLVPSAGIACVVPDRTSPSDVATGASSKRPDLVFYPSEPALKLDFAMEAKVIRAAVDIGNELLGNAGFGCFVRATDPYETNGVVGLLGYVSPVDTAAMQSEVELRMKAHARLKQTHSHELAIDQMRLHKPHTVIAAIKNATPKVCLANMLPVELTVARAPNRRRAKPAVPALP